jgi:hypothetical protein
VVVAVVAVATGSPLAVSKARAATNGRRAAREENENMETAPELRVTALR